MAIHTPARSRQVQTPVRGLTAPRSQPGAGRVCPPWLRYPAAGLALTAGAAHVPVTPEHLHEAPYIGVLFILLTAACVLGAAALVLSDTAVSWIGIGSVCLLAVIGYVVSRTLGLPLIGDDIGNWLEPLGVLSIATESAVAVLAVVRLRHPRVRRVL